MEILEITCTNLANTDLKLVFSNQMLVTMAN
jgi:hypothetical protein